MVLVVAEALTSTTADVSDGRSVEDEVRCVKITALPVEGASENIDSLGLRERVGGIDGQCRTLEHTEVRAVIGCTGEGASLLQNNRALFDNESTRHVVSGSTGERQGTSTTLEE